MTVASELECSHTSEAIRVRLAQGMRVNYLRDWIYGAMRSYDDCGRGGSSGSRRASKRGSLAWCCQSGRNGFATGASNYSGTMADRDNYKRVLEIEDRHIALVPQGEREEIRQLFAAKGVAGDAQ
jgi:hypothetical protein